MVVAGDVSAHVELVGSHGDWKEVSSALVPGAEHVYSNGSAEIHILGSVTTTVKDVLIG
jgi:hypothetical protein